MTGFALLNRRTLFRRTLQGFVGSLAGKIGSAATGTVLEIDRLAGESSRGTLRTHARSYRVHATITLLSVPLFSKENVGGARFLIEEVSSESSRTTAVQFSSGSWPDRLKGFNRFGMTQEAVREEKGRVMESAYLSFMTSSAEKNLDQARKAYDSRSASLPVSVAHGTARRSGYASALDHLAAPVRYTWLDCPRLMNELRGQLSPAVEAIVPADRDNAFQPFLHTVRSAMLAGAPSGERTFVHNAKLYRLRTKIAPASEGSLLIGWIAEQGTSHESEFRVWFDPHDAAALPVRFEFRPKSFLHLVFEHDPAVNGPVFSSLIPQEHV